MTEDEKKLFGWNLAMVELQRYYDKNYNDEIEAYYVVTQEAPDKENDSAKRDLFTLGGSYNYKTGYPDQISKEDDPRKHGVMRFTKDDGYSIYFPSRLEDLSDFTKMIYTKTDAEIRAEHSEYPMIIKKYEMLLKLLKDSDLTQFVKE